VASGHGFRSHTHKEDLIVVISLSVRFDIMSSLVAGVVGRTTRTRAGPMVLLARRGFVKTGEKVPINYVKGKQGSKSEVA
jgi:hypothetical protein